MQRTFKPPSRLRMTSRKSSGWLGPALLVLSVTAGVAQPADRAGQKYEAPRHVTGSIFDPAPGELKLLFRFERTATRTEFGVEVVRNFTHLDGSLAARERVRYRGDQLLAYEFEALQSGEAGSATIVADPGDPSRRRIDIEYTPPGSDTPKTASEPWRENTLVSDMIVSFILSHWEALMEGAIVSCRYLVVPRTETLSFTFRQQAEETFAGRPVVVIRMQPENWLIRLLVKPVIFTFEKEGEHRCLRYSGRTTPKVLINGHWNDLDAITVFD